MTTLFSDAGKVLGNLRPAPLTIINPKAFGSFYDINNQILLNNAKSIVGGTINNAIDNLQSLTSSSSENVVNSLLLKDLSNTLINSIFEVNGINEDTLDYFSFRINPNRLSKRRKKITTQKYTGGGWDMDTRGEELIVYSYNGSSGSLVAVEIRNKLMSILNGYLKNSAVYDSYLGNIIDYLIYSPKLSSAYLKMVLFEMFWKSNNDDMLIVFEDNAYLGKFNSFEFSQDAMNPYQINYSFDFVVYPEFNYNTNTGWITIEDERKMKKRFSSIITVPLQNNGVTVLSHDYSYISSVDEAGQPVTAKITEAQITFDVIYTDYVKEMNRRFNMAKFYAGSVNKDNSLISAGQSLLNNITSSSTGVSSEILSGDVVWLDGNIIKGNQASSFIRQRCNTKFTKQVIKESDNIKLETMDKNVQYIKSSGSDNTDDRITPQDLATKYNKLSGIDIFEDSITFNLKK